MPEACERASTIAGVAGVMRFGTERCNRSKDDAGGVTVRTR